MVKGINIQIFSTIHQITRKGHIEMDIKALADSILSNIEKVIYGKPHQIRLIIAALPAIFEETLFRGIFVGRMHASGWGSAPSRSPDTAGTRAGCWRKVWRCANIMKTC